MRAPSSIRKLRAEAMTLISLPLILGILALATPASAGETRPFRFDDMLDLASVVDAQASPKGEAVLITVKAYDPKEKAWGTHLEIVRPGQRLRLTTSAAGEHSADWSPDGAQVAFLSSRDGETAVYTIPIDGGEATKLVELPLGGTALRWIPDGSGLIFAAKVFEDCGADFACTKKKMEEKKDSGVTALVYDDLLMRPWSFWRDGRVQHVFRYRLETKAFDDLTPGDADVPPLPFGGRDELSLSPDGARLAYTLKPKAERAWHTDTHIVELDLASGARHQLPGAPGADGQPRYSPDGRKLAYISLERDQYESDRHRLMVWDRSLKLAYELTEGFDDWAMEPSWAPSGDALYFSTIERGRRPIYRVTDARGARAERIIRDGSLSLRGLTRWGQQERLVLIHQAFHQPPRLTVSPTTPGATLTPVTQLNRERLGSIDFAEVRDFDVAVPTERDPKRQVHGFVLTPKGLPKRGAQPFIVLIHGGPQGSWLDSFHPRWNAQLFAGMGWPVVVVDPAGSVGYGQAFVEEVSKDWGGQPYEDILAVVDELAKDPRLDGERVCAAGGSYGGYMVNWIEGHSERFRCLVSHAGVSNHLSMYGSTDELFFPEWEFGGTPWEKPALHEKWNPILHVANFKTPMLVIHGQNDMRVPLEQGLQMFTVLKRQGVDARLVVYPDETHFVTKPANARFWYDEVENWFARYLKDRKR